MLDDGLERIDLAPAGTEGMPAAADALLADACARTLRIQRAHPKIRSFVASDPRLAYRLLASVVASGCAPGSRFCEWGSGIGSVTCIASLLGFDACGIEIEPALVAESRRLAEAHGLSPRLVEGSYRPEGAMQERLDPAMLSAALGFSPADFDIVYVFPWPAEHRIVNYLFRTFAPPGALLLALHGGAGFSVLRKPPGDCAQSEIQSM